MGIETDAAMTPEQIENLMATIDLLSREMSLLKDRNEKLEKVAKAILEELYADTTYVKTDIPADDPEFAKAVSNELRFILATWDSYWAR